MVSPTLLASALLALATSVGFGVVSALLLRRAPPARGHAARVLFSLFWVSAAAVWAAQGLQNLAAAFDVATFGLVSALDQVTTPFYCLAGAGLLYYTLYLVTGQERLLVPILLFYLVVFFLIRWSVEDARRLAIEVKPWLVAFRYETPLQGPAYTVAVALLAVPLLAAVLAHASILLHVRDPAARYRIALTSVGLLVWITTEALSYTSGFANTNAGELTRRLVALASAGIVVLAYVPPRFARERWRAEPVLGPLRARPPPP